MIDVYFKLKTLHELGIKILLHCFINKERPAKNVQLEQICERVYYYPRKNYFQSLPIKWPYIVLSRKQAELLVNLCQNNAPIFFEGLHTCAYLGHPQLNQRLKMVRMHNIEQDYYHHLADSEKNWLKKLYFKQEANQLAAFEGILQQANLIFGISPNDTLNLSQRYNNVHYLPVFHPNEQVKSLVGKGDYALYHGNLSVNENIDAAIYLIEKVFNDLNCPFIITGKNPSPRLKQAILPYKHIQLIPNPTNEQMDELIAQAHINVLPTFQATGIKLKLLNALFKGRFCVVNSPMVANTQLETLCHIAINQQSFKEKIKQLFDQDFNKEQLIKRQFMLTNLFCNTNNGKKLLQIVKKNLY